MKASRHRWVPFAALVACAAVLTAPALVFRAVFGEDLYHHLVWSSHFDEQFRMGQLYPRWLFGSNAGFGGPVFYFYGPVPFHVGALISYLGIDVPRQLAVSAWLSVFLSGATAWLWARRIGSREGALVAALVYMALPYHINVDLYQRFAYGELWSFVWLPLVLAATHAIATGSRTAVVVLAIAYALLIATHLPTTLILSVLPLAYCLVVAPRGRRVGNSIAAFAGMVAGMGLAAGYLVPALTTQAFASFATLVKPFTVDSYLDASTASDAWRLVAFDGSAAASRTVILWSALFSFVVVAIFFAASLQKPVGPGHRRQSVFWIAIAGLSLFVMHRASSPLWDAVPTLQRVQFPWRVNVLIAASAIPLIAIGWRDGVLARRRTAQVLAAVLAAAALLFWIPTAKSVYWGVAKGDRQTTLGDSLLAPEYRPAAVPRALYDGEHLDDLATMPRAGFDAGGTASVTTWNAREIVVDATSDHGGTIRLHQFWYPGWAARLDGSLPIATAPTSDGLLSVYLPAGRHVLRVEREPLHAEWIGAAVSALTALSLAVFAWRARRSGGARS